MTDTSPDPTGNILPDVSYSQSSISAHSGLEDLPNLTEAGEDDEFLLNNPHLQEEGDREGGDSEGPTGTQQ